MVLGLPAFIQNSFKKVQFPIPSGLLEQGASTPRLWFTTGPWSILNRQTAGTQVQAGALDLCKWRAGMDVYMCAA